MEVKERIKKLLENFYKIPIGELPKDHFWIDRDNHLCCGQIHTKFIVDVTESTDKEFEQGKELMEKFHRGFKNKHYKKAEIINLMDEVERVYLHLKQLERKAGFFDKRGNIFEEENKKSEQEIKENSKRVEEAHKELNKGT